MSNFEIILFVILTLAAIYGLAIAFVFVLLFIPNGRDEETCWRKDL